MFQPKCFQTNNVSSRKKMVQERLVVFFEKCYWDLKIIKVRVHLKYVCRSIYILKCFAWVFFFLVVQVWVFYPGERRAHLLTCQWQHTNKTVIIIVTCPPTRGLGPPLWSEILVIPAGQVCYFFKLIELQAFGGSYSLLLPFLWAFSKVTDKAWTFFSFSVKGHLQCQHSTSLVQDPGSRILCIFFFCISIFEKSSIL